MRILYYNILMGKHTLRNLGETKVTKKKHKTRKKSVLKPHILILVALAVLIASTIASNAILFANNYYYVNGCQLGYEADCTNTVKNDIITYVVLMILPIAFAAYAIARTFAKRQNIFGAIGITFVFFAVFSPSIIIGLHHRQVDHLQNTTLLSIKTPDSQQDCDLIGLSSNSNNSCHVTSGAVPYQVKKYHNSAVIPLKINDDQIIIHLDSALNIFNATKQNIHVCTYFGDNPQANCRELIYSTKTANTYSDDFYSYSYQNNQLTITNNKN